MPIAEMRNISKVFKTKTGTVQALNEVSLSIEEGSFSVILGKSGSGKSTLLNILGFMDDPSSGEYLFDGIDALSLSSDEKAGYRLEKIGFVFQQFNLIYSMTAFENVELPLGYRGMETNERRERAEGMLKAVGLSERKDHKPQDMSGGEQQRVAVARALAGKPRLLLADEPTGSLDRESSESLISLMLKLHAEYKQTMIIVTHDEKIADLADNVYILDSGNIICRMNSI